VRSSELTTLNLGDVSDCEPILHLFLIPDLDGIAGSLWYITHSNPSEAVSYSVPVLFLHGSLQCTVERTVPVVG
jgi:hypothetical protein